MITIFVYLWCLVLQSIMSVSTLSQSSSMSGIPIDVPQRFVNKLIYGEECIPNLAKGSKAGLNIYRLLSHCPLVDNTIPIISEVMKKPFVPSKLKKVESAHNPMTLNTSTGVAAITYFTEDISDNECESKSECGESPWKKCKMNQLPPLTSIWGDSATYCCSNLSSFAGVSSITCISNGDSSDNLYENYEDMGEPYDCLEEEYDDLDDDHGVVYSSESDFVPDSYVFGSPTTLRELLITYNKMRHG